MCTCMCRCKIIRRLSNASTYSMESKLWYTDEYSQTHAAGTQQARARTHTSTKGLVLPYALAVPKRHNSGSSWVTKNE
jgi:hypothetical protein